MVCEKKKISKYGWLFWLKMLLEKDQFAYDCCDLDLGMTLTSIRNPFEHSKMLLCTNFHQSIYENVHSVTSDLLKRHRT